MMCSTPVRNRSLTVAAQILLLSLYAAPPTPDSHFGHPIGQDRTTLEWAQVVNYFYKLASESDRIMVREFGKSTEGRPMIVAYVSAPENLKRLEYYRQIQKKLADPRTTTPEEARKLSAEGKAIVLITCSVHATELASTHTAVEFAHRMATDNSAKTKAILDNVILMLAPSINPDGLDIVTKWYRKTIGTPHEGTSPPELYQKYVGHDNNRDWYIFSQAETRAVVSQLHNPWHPHIVYDVHQQGAFASRMFIPPWLDPLDPNVDPIIAQESNMVGMTMAADLTAAGRKGVVVNAIYDFWTPARHYQAYHGGLRILSESASARLASPITVRPEQIANQALGYIPRERSWNYLEPWLGGEWRLRDIIDDQLIAFESLLSTASSRREEFLRAFYAVNQRTIERRTPYAFVIPAQQADPGAARKLLETLDFGLVEIERAGAAFQSGSKEYPAGTFVIRMRQPFASFAKTLLERQHYPDLRQYPGGPPKRPYDVTAQTLPLLMGVAADTVDDQFQAQLTLTHDFSGFRGGLLSQGWLAASDSDAWKRVNAVWSQGRPAWRNPQNGNFYLGPAQPPGSIEIRKPRVGLYRGFMPNMDEGWTRWILEQFGWDYKSPGNTDIRTGNLRSKYDVLVFADSSPASIQNGYRPGSMPEEYTGGLGLEGTAALREFAEQGGRLIFLNDATSYALDFLDVKAKNVLKGVSNRDFYCPGSLLNVRAETGNWLTFGLPSEFTVWMEQSPVFELDEGVAAVRYSQSPVLASGWLLGEKYLAGKPALVEVPRGKGTILLFGFRPQYRAQSYLTLKLFFNALLGPSS